MKRVLVFLLVCTWSSSAWAAAVFESFAFSGLIIEPFPIGFEAGGETTETDITPDLSGNSSASAQVSQGPSLQSFDFLDPEAELAALGFSIADFDVGVSAGVKGLAAGPDTVAAEAAVSRFSDWIIVPGFEGEYVFTVVLLTLSYADVGFFPEETASSVATSRNVSVFAGLFEASTFPGAETDSTDPTLIRNSTVETFAETFDIDEVVRIDIEARADGLAASTIPEPATAFILGAGLIGLAASVRRYRIP